MENQTSQVAKGNAPSSNNVLMLLFVIPPVIMLLAFVASFLYHRRYNRKHKKVHRWWEFKWASGCLGNRNENAPASNYPFPQPSEQTREPVFGADSGTRTAETPNTNATARTNRARYLFLDVPAVPVPSSSDEPFTPSLHILTFDRAVSDDFAQSPASPWHSEHQASSKVDRSLSTHISISRDERVDSESEPSVPRDRGDMTHIVYAHAFDNHGGVPRIVVTGPS